MNKDQQTVEIKFEAVKFMRVQREILSDKLTKMSKTEIVKYLKRKEKDPTKPSA